MRAVPEAGLHAAAGQPHRVAVRIVVATVVPLRCRRAAEFASPQDQRFVQQAARLQILEQTGDRPVHLGGIVGMILFQTAMLIPLVAVRNLHEAHAALDEPPRHQALPAEIPRAILVQAVQPLRAAVSPATSCNSGAAVCMRKASSKASMRPSSPGSGPVWANCSRFNPPSSPARAAAARPANGGQ